MSEEHNLEKVTIPIQPITLSKTLTLLGLFALLVVTIGIWSSINTFILRELRSSLLSIVGSLIVLVFDVSIFGIVLIGIKGKSVKYKFLIFGGGAIVGLICFGLLFPVLYK